MSHEVSQHNSEQNSIALNSASSAGSSKLSESKHTPLPWKADMSYVYAPESDTSICEPCDNPCSPSESESIANARFVVQACNSHDALLAACDEGLHECERVKMHCTCKHKDLGSLLKRIERIEAAIALTKEG